MPRTPFQLHSQITGAEAAKSQKYARRLRETYVPSRLRRWLKEEGRLMLDFDSSPDAKGRLDALGGLLRIRLLILRGIGWPKEPTMRPGKLPNALDSVRSHNPLGDLDAEVLPVVAHPAAPAPEGREG